jgi:hypothetical protein
MVYKLNTNRPPYKVEAFQWDGTLSKNNWPAWAKEPAEHRHLKNGGLRLILIQPGSINLVKKGDYIVKYPSGNLAPLNEKDFKYNFTAM